MTSASRSASATGGALRTVYSTLAPEEIARAVEAGWPLGLVSECSLARRGFNDVYALQLADGRRCIARLSVLRARGAANVDYEAALLLHLQAQGVPVAAAHRASDGAGSVQLAAPEGARALAVFDFLEGEPPGEVIADIGATGAGLAQIHRAGASYHGPDSRYRLDLRHLLHRPLDWLLAAPTLDAPLRSDFQALARRLSERIGTMRGLSQVHCHGDCHGGNNFMTGAEGERVAAFFDFDDAGPGLLAYDLAVFLWSLLLRKGLQQPDADALEKWSAYLSGYRRVQPVAAADLGAVARFVAVRHFWFLGEYASRIPHWGSQTLPRAWLRKQVELFTAWEAMETPAT